MIINHRNKVMFFHLPKTGGSSVAHLLRQHGYRDDGPDENGHLSASDALKVFGDKFTKYFKFGCVRNPWELEVSRYLWTRRTRCDEQVWAEGSFKQFIKMWCQSQYKDRMNFDGLKINGKIILDYVIRFETLQEDFNTVCDKIGIPDPALPTWLPAHCGQIKWIPWKATQLPHKNKSEDRRHYVEYYDDETKQLVAEKYAKDVEYFGYKFGE